MNCEEARLTIGGAPSLRFPELTEHLQGCAACTKFRKEMTDLEREIAHTLESPPRLQPAKARQHRRAGVRWALAASMLLAISIAGVVWTLWPSQSLARDVVHHVEGEPDSWASAARLDEVAVNKILHGSGIALIPGLTDVAYAHSCWFRGHFIPHLVVRTEHGPMTVLVLRHEHAQAPRQFAEAGFSGTIVPVRSGAIAVLARGNGDVGEAAARFEKSVRWLPDSR